MVGIVRADDYSSLMRRIGYSVGLERLRERFSELVEMYVDRRKFDTGDYIELAERLWKVESGLQDRSKKRAEHMADVYRSLGLFELNQLQVQPLAGLDIAAVAVALSSSFGKRELAKDAVLLHLIVEADADIFLNLLDCSFEARCASERLRRLVEEKRGKLTPLFPQRDIRERVMNHVDFKSQVAGNATKIQKPFFDQRVYAFAAAVEEPVQVSDDLVDKAVKTRRKWAEALGLWNGGLTARASALLAALDRLGLRLGKDGPLLIWPYEYALKSLRIFPEKAKIEPPSRWRILVGSISAFVGLSSQEIDAETDRDLVVDLCRRIFLEYKAADSLRSKIRAQVPLFVLEPAFAIYCACELNRIPDLQRVIELERRDPRRRLQITPIRGADGGVVVN